VKYTTSHDFHSGIGINADHSKTDTHGWLEGHIKEQNYGADWGDFVSFSRHMQHKAGNLGVDLLLVDTGTKCLQKIFLSGVN